MLSLLLNPLIRNIGVGVITAFVLIIAYSFWAMHERSIGFQTCKTSILATAQAHQNKVDETVRKVDEAVNATDNPVDQLQKFWSAQ